MKPIGSTDLKTILFSKRANLYYLQHCRVLVNGGRVEYVTKQGNESLYWNIPIANTTTLLLGIGTSITQAAVRDLSKAGVVIGFCGNGGTPLLSGTDRDLAIQWFLPQAEYRPTDYLQCWVKFWFSDSLRLEAAKQLQRTRISQIRTLWAKPHWSSDRALLFYNEDVESALSKSVSVVQTAQSITELLTEEGRLTKKLYGFVARATGYGSFTRGKESTGTDLANRFLDHGNYLAYGLGASATWVLGLPHGLAVLHGKTRRGGLVFDAADIIKDALVLPQAFISAIAGDNDQQFRSTCIDNFTKYEALDTIIDTLKAIADDVGAMA